MPIWLRKFTFSKLKSFYEEQKEAQEKAYGQLESSNKSKRPTFVTKAS